MNLTHSSFTLMDTVPTALVTADETLGAKSSPRRQQLSEEEMQNIQLLQARSRAFSAEYELLEFSISSSRTFFV